MKWTAKTMKFPEINRIWIWGQIKAKVEENRNGLERSPRESKISYLQESIH